MTIADSRVVAWQWRINLPGVGWTLWANGGEGLPPLAHSNEYTEREHRALVPESLLAEAESRIVALQARLDAVVGLADRWEKLAETHGIRMFSGNDHRLFANELRSAALGGESPASEEELK